jgi:rhodanese-related sulfurtransferase
MEKIIPFLMQHWILSTIFVVFLLIFIVNEVLHLRIAMPGLSPEQAVQLINHQEALVVDIRNEIAFREGHVLGAINLPLASLEQKRSALQKYATRPLLLVDALGQDSSKAVTQLRAEGFQVQVLAGGLEAWKERNLPLVKS